MKYNELMIHSLTELLEEGETLMHPIYGVLRQGNELFYGFFGLTETHLLIALVSGKTVTYTTRIPLNIRSVHIKQNIITRDFVIDIGFDSGAPCRITAYKKVLMMDSQKKNFPLFTERLSSLAKSNEPTALGLLHGTRIRWQYFSVLLYIMMSFAPMPLIMIAFLGFEAGNYGWSDLWVGLWVWFVFLSPLILLAILNRFAFGKILCVANEKGLHFEATFVAWKDLKKIEYHPDIFSKHKANYSRATFIVKDGEDGEFEFDVLHFPLHGLKKIKKYAPNVAAGMSSGSKLFVAFLALSPSLIALVMCFVL